MQRRAEPAPGVVLGAVEQRPRPPIVDEADSDAEADRVPGHLAAEVIAHDDAQL
ncbi:MAG: hypothetical protein M3487_00350 [Actinomycetota bacterium]|nr:hypothetical protein [Actinomycetota bacterium]